MKRKTWLTFLYVMTTTILIGCSNPSEPALAPAEETSTDVDTTQVIPQSTSDETVDIDLTTLSSTMIFSQIYDINMAPEGYIGKTIKMNGFFKSYPSPETDAVHFAVIIPDALACCEQGFEFVLNGDYTYPEDYPTDDTDIQITGVLDTYEENGYEYYYVVADELTVLQ